MFSRPARIVLFALASTSSVILSSASAGISLLKKGSVPTDARTLPAAPLEFIQDLTVALLTMAILGAGVWLLLHWLRAQQASRLTAPWRIRHSERRLGHRL